MKKKIVIGIVAVLLIAAIIFALLPRVSVDGSGGANLRFFYQWANIRAMAEDSDAELLADIVNGKRLRSEIYLNGFSQEIAFQMDGITFCPARDGAPIVFLAEKNRYITISHEENSAMREILEGYGFFFPCPQ